MLFWEKDVGILGSPDWWWYHQCASCQGEGNQGTSKTKDPEAASCLPGVGGVLSAFHCGLPPVVVVSDTPYVCGED